MKIKIIFAVFLILLCKSVFAADGNTFEDENAENFSITGYPFPLVLGIFSLEGEYAINNRFSVCLEGKGFYWTLDETITKTVGDNETTSHGEWTVSGLMVGPGFRWYPWKKQMRGFFVGPYVSYTRLGLAYDHESGHGGEAVLNGWNAAVWTGYKWIVKHVVIEVSTGISYISMPALEVKYKNDLGSVQVAEFPVGLSTVYWPGIGIGFGFAF